LENPQYVKNLGQRSLLVVLWVFVSALPVAFGDTGVRHSLAQPTLFHEVPLKTLDLPVQKVVGDLDQPD